MKLRAIAYLVFFWQVIFSTSSFAVGGNGWVETGNGGFVMICPNSPSKLLDLHEGQTQLNMVIDQTATSLDTVIHRVNFILDRLSKSDPYRGAVYKSWFRSFFREATFIEGQIFFPVPDVGFTYIPKDCHLELAVFQRQPDFRTQFRYTINYDIWSVLDIENKAALIMHELIYREASNSVNAHRTSEYARYLNAWVHSVNFGSETPLQFIQRVQQLNLQHAYYKGFNLKLGSYNHYTKQWDRLPIESYSNGTLKRSEITSLSKEAIMWVKPIASCFAAGMRLGKDQISASAYFNPQSELDKIEFYFTPIEKCMLHYKVGKQTIAIKGDHYVFHRDGSIEIAGGTANLELFAAHGLRMNNYFLSQRVGYTLNSQRRLTHLKFERTLCWSKDDSSINFYAQSPGTELAIEDINEKSLPTCRFEKPKY